MTFDWPRDPAWNPMAGKIYLAAINQISASPYTGSMKSINLDQIWRADVSWTNHSLALGLDIQAFIEQLEGASNPVRMFDWWRTEPSLLSSLVSGFSDGTIFTDGTGFTDGYAPAVLNAANRGEKFVAISGLPVSTACFKRGDLVGLGGYLYTTASGVSSNALGQALLPLAPGLRLGVAAGDVVNLYAPTVPMRLASPPEAINRHFNLTDGFSLTFIEDVPS